MEENSRDRKKGGQITVPNGRKSQGQKKRRGEGPKNCPKWKENPGTEKEEGAGQITVSNGRKIQGQQKEAK